MLFNKDNSESGTWDTLVGETNNVIIGKNLNTVTAFTGINAIPQNGGRLRRMVENTSLCATDTSVTKYVSSANLSATQKSYCTLSASTITFYIMAQIPMRYIHDLFEKMPLAKGGLYNLTITTHAPSSFVFALDANGAITSASPTVPHDFCPFMITNPSNTAGTGFLTAAAIDTVTAKCTIGNPSQQNCRMLVCMYEMNPIYESQYLSGNSMKRVTYNDTLYMRSTAGVSTAGGSTFSQLLTSSLSSLRRLIIIPFSDASTGGTYPLDPLLSPFSSAGGTLSSPYSFVSNLQVLISGNPLFPQPLNYRYQQFLQEVYGWNSINGNLTDGMRNCLISEADYNGQYGVISINLQRHSEDSDVVPKSVQIQFRNETARAMNYHFFLVYERYFDLDCASGQLVIGNT
jgi:hypothetical protein